MNSNCSGCGPMSWSSMYGRWLSNLGLADLGREGEVTGFS